jgi:Aspartyl protease
MGATAANPVLLSALILAASTFFTTAHAEDCGPLKQVASVDVTMSPNGLPMVPVTLNGTPRKFLFGTGGGRSNITQAAADSLNLHPLSSRVRLLNTNGSASSRFVSADSFVYGGLEGKDLELLISPNVNLGSPNLPVDGELAGDIMERYDTEMDFAAGKISYFMTDHCDGHVVHWTSAPASAVPFRRSQPGSRNIADTHIRFHVTLDGKDLLAVMSTASPRSQLSAKTADADFNVTADTQGAVPLGTMSGRKVFGYVFKSISFGDVTVLNPHVAVIPDIIGLNDPENTHRTDSLIKRVDDNLGPDLTIGMDVLKQLHIYVATGEDKLYITAADQPAARP